MKTIFNSLLNNNSNELIIRTNHVKVKGFLIHDNVSGCEYYQFLGIPYAKAPVGELRFRAPEPLPPRHEILVANQWPDSCKQSDLKQRYLYLRPIMNYNTSEDCLYLNIWTPMRNSTDTSLRPVIVFIHGGSFESMGISLDLYNGAVTSSIGDVVFVTINYRLGIFGFLDTGADKAEEEEDIDDEAEYKTFGGDEDVVKNAGIYDQIMALNWIKDNVRHFGGNPNSVTLMGNSAGAVCVGLLMATPMASHLFHRAILESSSPMNMKNVFEISNKSYRRVLETTECNSIQCLRQLSADVLTDIQWSQLNSTILSFSPSIPSDLWGQFPREAFNVEFADNGVQQKAILLGGNSEEGQLFLHHLKPKLFPLYALPDIDRTGVLKVIRELMANLNSELIDTQMESILNVALEASDTTSAYNLREKLSVIIGEFVFKCPLIKFADVLSEWPNITVYMYYFTERTGILPEWMGSTHGEEVHFLFGSPIRHPHLFSQKQREFSIRMIKTLSHFARTGEMLPQLGKVWPKYNAKSGQHMELNAEKSEINRKLNESYYTLYDMLFESF